MSIAVNIAGLRVRVEVAFGDSPKAVYTAERAYQQNRAHNAAEADRNRWIVNWGS
ncbi:MAG: hypothetical protein M1370_05950 [Bacteroidetes bacterium]|nr:hypothetical protein [Bacteroidota bacterium]